MEIPTISREEVKAQERQRVWDQFCKIILDNGNRTLSQKYSGRGPFELLSEVCNSSLDQFRAMRGKTSWN